MGAKLYHPGMTTDTPAVAPISDAVRQFLEAPHVASVGTTGADGEPHQAIAWYRLDPDDRILLNSRYPRRWPRDLQRDPRVSLAVLDGGDSMRWVGISGVVESIVDDLDQARDDICALAVRYDDAAPDRLAEFRTQPRISFRIRILAIHDHLD
ncbi:MAG: TIGR03618 family F420-dependent PPOX class oxidoreductase [Chloroflexota bacterium]|nr:MAG: TIGR03618 family F420-dependent PPOX class oxidoreductase [Chloroflexota bacterium]